MTTDPQTPTEAEIKTALCRDEFYGQIPRNVVVPTGYDGPASIDGIRVKVSADVDVPYIVSAEGGQLGFDGLELKPNTDDTE